MMEEKDRELMERYIYAVVRRLPREQRGEVAMELTELIEDMAKEEPMEAVLGKLGDPAEFARKYRGENNYLIGPDYYDNYEWVLKIVLLCVLASAVISALVQGVVDSDWTWNVIKSITVNMSKMISNMIINAVNSTIFAVGSVTLIFAVMERMQIKAELKREKEWSVNELEHDPIPEKRTWTPQRLDPVPDKRALISRGESVVSIVFAAIFCGLLIFVPYLLGAFVFEDHQLVKTIPIFNLEQWHLILPVLLASLMIGFIDDLIKLIKGCYCRLVMISSIVTDILQLVLMVIALKLLPFWNPNFMQDIERYFKIHFDAKADILSYFGTDTFSNILLLIFVFAVCLDMGTTIYKTLRYGTE